MISVTDLRNGTFFMEEGHPYKVLNYEHIKVSRGGATIKVKAKNLITGSIKDISYSNGSKVEDAEIENQNYQYLYSDGENLVFMDLTDYSQVELAVSNVEEMVKYLIENQEYQLTLFKGKPISIILPASMFYKVKYAPDAVKGDTSKSAYKKVTLENDLEVDAPMFIKEGDVVKVNTTTGEYTGRFN